MKKTLVIAAIAAFLAMPCMALSATPVEEENSMLKDANIRLQKENMRLTEENERLNRENDALSPSQTKKEAHQIRKEQRVEGLNAMEFNKTGNAMENGK